MYLAKLFGTFMMEEIKVRDNFTCSLIMKCLYLYSTEWQQMLNTETCYPGERQTCRNDDTNNFYWIINTVTSYENSKMDCKLIPACNKLSNIWIFLILCTFNISYKTVGLILCVLLNLIFCYDYFKGFGPLYLWAISSLIFYVQVCT